MAVDGPSYLTRSARQSLLVVVQEEQLVREGPVRGKERRPPPEEAHDAADDDHGRPGARLRVAEGQLRRSRGRGGTRRRGRGRTRQETAVIRILEPQTCCLISSFLLHFRKPE